MCGYFWRPPRLDRRWRLRGVCNPPTVARRIDGLEHEIELVLFDCTTRGFRATEAAHRLVPMAEAVEAAAEAFADQTRKLAQTRPIRITSPGLFADRVNDIFTKFSLAHPGVVFEFLPGLKQLDLLAGEADIEVRVSIEPPDDRLICRKISTIGFAIYGSQAYADRFELPRSVEDFGGHRFISFQSIGSPHFLHDWLLRHVSPDQIVMTYGELDLMQASIRAGHGLGLLTCRMADADPLALRCFEDIDALARQNMMVIAPESYRRVEVKAFTRFFAPRYSATFT